MIKTQMIAMLDYLGVPYKDQPKQVGDKKFLLEKYRKIDGDRYKEAYSIIMLHKIPDSMKGDAQAIAFEEIGNLIRKMWEQETSVVGMQMKNKSDEALADLQTQYRRHLSDMAKDAREEASRAIAVAAKTYVTHQAKVGTKKAVKIDGIVPEYFEALLQLASQRINILLVGPAGCGKTYTAFQLANALQLPVASQSCSQGVSESVFTGWLLPTGEGGTFEHKASEFLNMYENGGVFLFDEMDRSDPNVLVFLNQALANDGFYLPQRFDNPYVKKHPDFIAIGATNTFGNGADTMYHAATALDASTLDRFKVGTIQVGYSKAVEEKLVSPNLLAWGRHVRKAIDKNKLRKVMSTRVLIDGTEMMRGQDWTMERVQQGYFADWSREEKAIVTMGDM